MQKVFNSVLAADIEVRKVAGFSIFWNLEILFCDIPVRNENFYSEIPSAIHTNSQSNAYIAGSLCSVHFCCAGWYDSGIERSISKPAGHSSCESRCEHMVGVII